MANLQRTFASGVQFSLGMVSASFDVVPVRKAKKGNVQICGECEDPTKLRQMLHCPNCEDHVYDPGTAPRAREVDGSFIPLSAEDLAEVAGDFPSGAIDFSVCPIGELLSKTRPDNTQYRVRLNNKGQSADRYALFLDLASSAEYALYGRSKLNGRTSPTSFQLVVWNGQLVLQSLIDSQDIADLDDIQATAKPSLIEMGREYLERVVAPFDEEILKDSSRDRLQAIIDAKKGGTAVVAKTKGTTIKADDSDELESALAAVLAKNAKKSSRKVTK